MQKTLVAGYHGAFARYRVIVGNANNRQMIWTVSDQFMVSAINFLVGIIATKLLGIVAFGQLSLIMILAVLAGELHHNALTTPTMTLAGGRKRRTKSYYAAVAITGYALSLLLAAMVAGAIAAVYGLRGESFPTGLVAASFAITLFQTNHNNMRRLLFAQARGRTTFYLDATRYILLAAGVGLLWWLKIKIDATTLLLLFAASAFIAALPMNLHFMNAPLRVRLIRSVLQRHWPIARWLILMLLISMGQEQVVWLVVGVVLGDEAIGGLRAGQHLLGITHFLLMAMENFMPRQATEAFVSGGRAGLRHYFTRQSVWIGFITIALLLVLVVPAKFWMGTVYGPEYLPYVPVLWVFAISYIAMFIREIGIMYHRAIEQNEKVFYAFAISSVMAVIVVYPAVLYGGVMGAALVMMSANIVSTIYLMREVVKHNHASESS